MKSGPRGFLRRFSATFGRGFPLQLAACLAFCIHIAEMRPTEEIRPLLFGAEDDAPPGMASAASSLDGNRTPLFGDVQPTCPPSFACVKRHFRRSCPSSARARRIERAGTSSRRRRVRRPGADVGRGISQPAWGVICGVNRSEETTKRRRKKTAERERDSLDHFFCFLCSRFGAILAPPVDAFSPPSVVRHATNSSKPRKCQSLSLSPSLSRVRAANYRRRKSP